MNSVGIGLIGTKFMGKVHSRAYRDTLALFDVKVQPQMRVICGRDKNDTHAAAERYGWLDSSIDWEEVVARDDVQVIDISTTGNMHAPIAVAAAQQGKHILCEKPLANTMAEARQMVQAVEEAGVINTVCFNYRRVPAIAQARRLIDTGEIGDIYHWRAVWLEDWAIDAKTPLVWRFQADKAGSGSLGDLGSHLIDLAHFLVGPIHETIGMTETFVKERPLLPAERTADRSMGAVTVDDGALFLARFENGALGSFEATRFAGGNRDRFLFEINGSKGSLRFDFQRMNELQFYSWSDPGTKQGYRTIVVGQADHPYVGNWWPTGLGLGYDAAFVHTIYDFLNCLAADESAEPNFRQGLRVQSVLETTARSIAERRWVAVGEIEGQECGGPFAFES